jgi:hypothetical protein
MSFAQRGKGRASGKIGDRWYGREVVVDALAARSVEKCAVSPLPSSLPAELGVSRWSGLKICTRRSRDIRLHTRACS